MFGICRFTKLWVLRKTILSFFISWIRCQTNVNCFRFNLSSKLSFPRDDRATRGDALRLSSILYICFTYFLTSNTTGHRGRRFLSLLRDFSNFFSGLFSQTFEGGKVSWGWGSTNSLSSLSSFSLSLELVLSGCLWHCCNPEQFKKTNVNTGSIIDVIIQVVLNHCLRINIIRY